ncbi:3-hydroxyacyl-CoA dehydrogenase [Weissella sagaensis]|uniref:3-hydroxyacyl-CoA dehydrogenase n=2 Tax=Weissella sagaensis TaxID=2559928 RepID=A0ABW1RSD5_9LACO|nr:3-hydroxyacyl-CoA dehydrogenase [Weissella sagaensis]UEG67852.1 3-hydroxyacyl-CoA dehydrogenase [Weissella hellenica]
MLGGINMTIKNVTIAGGGVLGSQIAFQTAFSGFNVTLYDINDAAIAHAKELLASYVPEYQAFYDDGDKATAVIERMSFNTDLAQAVADADLVIEAIPESVKIKADYYTQLSEVAPEKTIFATNSSTFLPSQFVEYVDRPEKFLAIHFANQIWKNNNAEIMGHAGTADEYLDELVAFAKDIRMVPFRLYKEQHGYILNSLLVPLLDAAQKLWVNGVADPHTIDKSWMIATGAPQGPFAILDVVGLNTPYNLSLAKAEDDEEQARIVKALKEMIDAGKTGAAAGEGFYTYPNPEFTQDDFLK